MAIFNSYVKLPEAIWKLNCTPKYINFRYPKLSQDMLVKIKCFPNKNPSVKYQFAMENDPFIGYLPVKMLMFIDFA